jgi:hypothetical protein
MRGEVGPIEIKSVERLQRESCKKDCAPCAANCKMLKCHFRL